MMWIVENKAGELGMNVGGSSYEDPDFDKKFDDAMKG